MKTYRISKGAARDLDGIFVYWAERASVETADKLIDSITDRFWMLAENPEAGRAAPEAAPEVRCFPAGRYLIYYKKTRGGIEILYVLHSARNRRKALRQRLR